MACPSCGLQLPATARFCVRCGAALQAGTPPPPRAPGRPAAPVWLLVLLWVGAGGLLWIAASYAAFAFGLIPPKAVGVGSDVEAVRGASTLLAPCAASLAIAHAAAAIGLMASRPWARPFATLVCVVWALTCVGLPVALLAIGSLWRGSRGAPTGSLPNSRTSP